MRSKVLVAIMIVVAILILSLINETVVESITGYSIQDFSVVYPGLSLVFIIVACLIGFVYIKKKHENS